MFYLFRKFLKSYFSKVNKLSLVRYLRSQEFINSKLINRTRKRIVESISEIIIDQCQTEIALIFKEYLVNNLFSEKDAEMYLKAFDSTEEKFSKHKK
jgi:hypothetical protein